MRAASARVQTHPAAPASPRTHEPELPKAQASFKETAPVPEPGRRRMPATAAPAQTASEPATPTTSVRTHSPEEVENDPLVKTVLDVFEGEIKRVQPKNT